MFGIQDDGGWDVTRCELVALLKSGAPVKAEARAKIAIIPPSE
jgi:hypothetical protein